MLIGLAILLCAPQAVHARRWAIPEAPGKWRIVEDKKLKIQRSGLEPTTPSITFSYLLNDITWNVTYLDPAGEGFNDPVTGDVRRQAAVNAMLTISNTLQYTTGTLDVLFYPSSSAYADVLAYAGTPFPAEPNGFYNGMAFEHIKTKIDPSPELPDIYCTVNFDYPFHAGAGLPAEGEYDLESILLHEFTHGMGLISLAAEDGSSRINFKNPGIFSVWDSMLQTTTGTSLWVEGGSFNGTPNNLTGTPDLVFSGPYARRWNQNVPPLVYTPSKFESGGSLSHWDDSVGNSIMKVSIDPGTVKRHYSSLDKAALHDLGWQVIMVAGTRSSWALYE